MRYFDSTQEIISIFDKMQLYKKYSYCSTITKYSYVVDFDMYHENQANKLS